MLFVFCCLCLILILIFFFFSFFVFLFFFCWQVLFSKQFSESFKAMTATSASVVLRGDVKPHPKHEGVVEVHATELLHVGDSPSTYENRPRHPPVASLLPVLPAVARCLLPFFACFALCLLPLLSVACCLLPSPSADGLCT